MGRRPADPCAWQEGNSNPESGKPVRPTQRGPTDNAANAPLHQSEIRASRCFAAHMNVKTRTRRSTDRAPTGRTRPPGGYAGEWLPGGRAPAPLPCQRAERPGQASQRRPRQGRCADCLAAADSSGVQIGGQLQRGAAVQRLAPDDVIAHAVQDSKISGDAVGQRGETGIEQRAIPLAK